MASQPDHPPRDTHRDRHAGQAPEVRITSSRVVYENRWMRVREDEFVRRDGSAGLYAVVEKSPAALIVPTDGAHVWLIEQYRHPVAARFWEFPQGAIDGRPDAEPEEIARAELREETGLRAGRLVHLGRLYFAYGLSDQSVDVWCAEDLHRGEQDLEPEEATLRVERMPVAEVEAMVADGRIADAASVAAWGMVRRRRPGGP
jgi:ADP-ribose pyrophosphatase